MCTLSSNFDLKKEIKIWSEDQSVCGSEGTLEIFGGLRTLMSLKCTPRDNWNLNVNRKNLEDFQFENFRLF